jgi:hypothetical protein
MPFRVERWAAVRQFMRSAQAERTVCLNAGELPAVFRLPRVDG